MRNSQAPIRCVLFDLDGTLVDTAPDLVGALNRLRSDAGLEALPLDELRHLASHGTGALLLAGFPHLKMSEQKKLASRFLDGYLERIAEDSRLFPGIANLLDEMDAARIIWGVVTNKPQALTQPLIKALSLSPHYVVSGDSLAQRKPDPAPVAHACRLCRAEPGQTLYVGDAERDVQAGKAAGARTAVALWGYLDPTEDAQLWRADYYLENPKEIRNLLMLEDNAQGIC